MDGLVVALIIAGVFTCFLLWILCVPIAHLQQSVLNQKCKTILVHKIEDMILPLLSNEWELVGSTFVASWDCRTMEYKFQNGERVVALEVQTTFIKPNYLSFDRLMSGDRVTFARNSPVKFFWRSGNYVTPTIVSSPRRDEAELLRIYNLWNSARRYSGLYHIVSVALDGTIVGKTEQGCPERLPTVLKDQLHEGETVHITVYPEPNKKATRPEDNLIVTELGKEEK